MEAGKRRLAGAATIGDVKDLGREDRALKERAIDLTN